MKTSSKILLAVGLLAIVAMVIVSLLSSASEETRAPLYNQSPEQILQDTLRLAKEGKVINSEGFGIGSMSEKIQDKWGEPEEKTTKKGVSATMVYKAKEVFFMTDNAGKVNFIETYDNRLINRIPLSTVRKVLGKPDREMSNEGNTNLELYYDQGKVVLTIVFKTPTAQTPDPKVKMVYLYPKHQGE